MNCEQFNDALEEFLDGSLAENEQAAVRTHLESCAACREIVRRREAVGGFAQFSMQRQTQELRLDAETRRNIFEALQSEETSSSWFETFRGALLKFGLAFALLVLVGIIFSSHLFPSKPAKESAGVIAAEDDARVIDIPFQTETHVSHMGKNGRVDAIVSSSGVLEATFSEKNVAPTSTKPRSENRGAEKI